MPLKSLLRIVLVCAFGCLAPACPAGPPFDTDDPGTPEHHHFEVNIGYFSSQIRGSEAQAFPGFDIGYGYSNNIQFAVAFSGLSLREAGEKRIDGLGDTELEAKWRFLEETRHGPQAALAYGIKVPTASRARSLGTGIVDHTLVLAVQKSFGRSALTTNLGVEIPGDRDSRPHGMYGLLYTFQATEHLTVGAEVFGSTSAAPGEREEFAWSLGLSYAFAPDRAFFLSLGRSTQGFSDLNVAAGVQFDFGK